MPDPTITKRSARYRARAKERGLVEVRVRVPKGREDQVKEIAAAMREGETICEKCGRRSAPRDADSRF